MNRREGTAQQILLMGHVEEACEKRGLVPPVEVNVSDAGGYQYDFDFSPEYDVIDLPAVLIMPPVVLRMY